MSRTAVNAFVVALLLCLGQQVAWSDDWRVEDIDRVVAIADVHGDYAAMFATLRQADVVDMRGDWVGGTSHLVVVGDILDRGPESRAAMDTLMRLEEEAHTAGGRVHILLGNHESMVLTGDMRYVSAAEYAAFAADEDRSARARWLDLYLARRGGDAAASRVEFERKYPPGYFAMRRAFRPSGKYGAWLLQKNVIAVINGTAFVHGGLAPLVGKAGLSGVNKRMQRELVTYVNALNILTDAGILLPTDNLDDYERILNAQPKMSMASAEISSAMDAVRNYSDMLLLSTEGPLWYRNNAVCPGIIEKQRLSSTLQAIGAERVVVGHTPTPNRQVLQRFEGRLIEIDTGMFGAYYDGSGNALVLEHNKVSVINESGDAAIVPMNHPRRVGKRVAGLDVRQLEALLRSGDIVSTDSIDKNTSRVRISDGQNTVAAQFSRRRGRGFYPEVAAYRLDRLLQLDMVPIATPREVGGVHGSVQFLPTNSTDEASRAKTGAGGNALCSLADQWAAMGVFDILIYNEARTHARMLYDKSTWQLMLSGHRNSFASKAGRPRHLQSADIPISDGWKQALGLLSDSALDDTLSDVMGKRRLRALKARRDELLATRKY